MFRHVQKSLWVRVALIGSAIVGTLGLLALPPVRERMHGWFGSPAQAAAGLEKPTLEDTEYLEVNGTQGLRLSARAVASLAVDPKRAVAPKHGRALPRQIGTLNYDNDRLFIIRSRFAGELAEVREALDEDTPITPTRNRPVRFGDKVKQGDLLAVIWSQQLGAAKAALVDALCAVRLSQDNMRRYEELYAQGAIAHASVKAGERQLQLDSNTLLTAERSLKMWKLTKEEIDEIKTEANTIHEQKKSRSADAEMKWARVEIRVPWFDKANPQRELVVIEKNTNINDMVDPIASPPLFKLADTSRLQIWVHPPEEYLPLIRQGLQEKGLGRMKWDIRFHTDAPDAPAHSLDIVQIAPSLEPNQHTPMVLGYLPNPDGNFLIGQFISATIFTPPEDGTVEIPTVAVNEVEGQAFVFVQSDPGKHEYFLRRVAVVKRFHDVTLVRSSLTEADKLISAAEAARGRRPLQTLAPNERVITRGVVELTAALEDLETKERIARKNVADKKTRK